MKNDDFHDSEERFERRQRRQEMMRAGPLYTEEQMDKVKAENARLRAELESLRPKPVVEVRRYRYALNSEKQGRLQEHIDGNIELTFDKDKVIKVELV